MLHERRLLGVYRRPRRFLGPLLRLLFLLLFPTHFFHQTVESFLERLIARGRQGTAGEESDRRADAQRHPWIGSHPFGELCIAAKAAGDRLFHIGKSRVHGRLGFDLLVGQEIGLAQLIFLFWRWRPVRRRARIGRAASVFSAHICPPLLCGIRHSPSTIQFPLRRQSIPAPPTRRSVRPASI